MADNKTPRDTSFIHSYHWQSPEADIEKALDIISCTGAHEPAKCPAARIEYSHVSYALAGNPDTPAEVLDHISSCLNHPKILERVATNSSTNKQTLKRLASHGRSEVRQAVAENHKLDLDTIKVLLRDEHTDVRYTLAENNSLPLAALIELTADENPYVAYRAEMTRQHHNEQTRRNSTDELPPGQKPLRRVV